ncbi:MAG: hypothetical protein P1U63_11050 [Coxiellaceae bacterium]|nr:hypothetical protein [Coxiellaceae bacterium]
MPFIKVSIDTRESDKQQVATLLSSLKECPAEAVINIGFSSTVREGGQWLNPLSTIKSLDKGSAELNVIVGLRAQLLKPENTVLASRVKLFGFPVRRMRVREWRYNRFICGPEPLLDTSCCVDALAAAKTVLDKAEYLLLMCDDAKGQSYMVAAGQTPVAHFGRQVYTTGVLGDGAGATKVADGFGELAKAYPGVSEVNGKAWSVETLASDGSQASVSLRK